MGTERSRTRDIPAEELASAQRVGLMARHNGSEYLSVRLLPTGRAVFLRPWSYGGLVLNIGSLGVSWFDDEWNFQAEQHRAAWRAALGWNGEGDPEGWYRHPASGRRRPEGDPTKEFVRP
jgi:hypothetical protein